MNTTQLTPRRIQVPAGSRGGAGKIILIVLAVIFALVLVVVGIFGYFAWRVSKAFHADKSGNVSLSVPGGGSFNANEGKTYTAEELGVDVYPGATSAKGSFSMNTGKGSMITAPYVTADSAEAVTTYYKNKSGMGEKTTMDTDNGSIITFNKSQHDVVMVTVKGHAADHDNKTVIAIVHTKDMQ